VRQLIRRQPGRNLEQTIAQLSLYWTGWRGYFVSVRRPRSCATWTDGYRSGCARSPGAMALRQAALPRTAPTRDQHAAGGHYGSPRPRPVAAQSASRSPSRLARDLLRRARPAHPGAGRHMMPPPNRRVRTGTHGGVGGTRPQGFPLPD
jgi:hypothetical protein